MTQSKLSNIFTSPYEINDKADQALVNSMEKSFPIENKHYILSISNVKAHKKPYTQHDEKDAILQSKSLTYPIKGDLTLTSKLTGKVVDHVKDFPLLDSFHITGKHSLVYKGNNYVVSNQLVLSPGIYTRTKENTGELEAHFNTGKGASFRIVLDPRLKVFFLETMNTHTPVGPLLTHVFNVNKTEALKYMPEDVWDANQAFTAGKDEKILKSLYTRMVYTKDPTSDITKMATELRKSLEASTLSEETTKVTLGKSFSGINKEVILLTLRNLIQTHTKEREEDNRDSLQFKRVQNLPDFLRTRFAKEHETVRRVKNKLTFGLEKIDQNNPKIKDAVPSKPYNKVYSAYIQQSSLISTPQETNPIESVENIAKVTVLGPAEGGISEERGVPMAARNIDPSHLGIIDPSRTPESSHAGIDQRFTMNAKRDNEGRLYAAVLNAKTGKKENLSVTDMMSHVIGFPDQMKSTSKMVEVQDHGEMRRVPREKVEYWVDGPTSIYTVTTNLVPFMNSNHPGRLTMAGKAIPQALSLVEREAPLVQTLNEKGRPFVESLGKVISTVSPVDGVVTKATTQEIAIRDDAGELHKVRAIKNLPFNMKGFQDDETPLVKVGDRVKKFQVIFDNNYTKGGNLALGRTLTTSYMPYHGYNHEDGIVISESAARGLASHHAYKVDYEVTADIIARKSLLKRYFPGKFTPEQLAKLDDQGYVKVGEILNYGDPVYAVLERREPSPEDRILGNLHKSLINPYRLVLEPWSHEENGEVVDAHTDSKSVRILLRSIKHIEVGDKLTGLHGNKGVVSLVQPDHLMPTIKDTGKAVDLVINPASVTSRINLGQLMETAAGKIAQKTGTPYLVKNFEHGNNIEGLQAKLKEHGLKDTEHLINPATGHSYGEVFTGPSYILKLYKTSDSGYSARNVGGYDNTLQPTKGGEEGSKAVGWMEMLGLLGSDARHNLKEMTTLKAEQNDDYWSKFIRGEPLPKPKTTFATQKFFDYLRGSGINVKVKGGNITAAPLTDHDILHMSNGEIKEPSMLNAKNLEPEDGGMFDQVITGGVKGDKWSHFKLAEPIVNPIFENPVKSMLGLSSREYEDIVSGRHGVVDMGGGVFKIVETGTNKDIGTIKI